MFDPGEFEAKARVFAIRALDADRDESERAFWAAASLELLGKAALARLHPTLLANPVDGNFGVVVLAAAGVIEPLDSAQTIPTKALWFRLERASKQFRRSEAEKISMARNEYLHGSGDIFFARLPADRWFGRFWHQFSLIAEAANRTIEDLVPAASLGEIERLIELEADALRQHLESRIEAARRRESAITAGRVTDATKLEFEQIKARVRAYIYSSESICPACGGYGKEFGDDIIYTEVAYPAVNDDGFNEPWDEPYAVHTIASEQFYCENCYLLLDRWAQLEIAGFEEGFQVVDPDFVIDWDGDYQNE